MNKFEVFRLLTLEEVKTFNCNKESTNTIYRYGCYSKIIKNDIMDNAELLLYYHKDSGITHIVIKILDPIFVDMINEIFICKFYNECEVSHIMISNYKQYLFRCELFEFIKNFEFTTDRNYVSIGDITIIFANEFPTLITMTNIPSNGITVYSYKKSICLTSIDQIISLFPEIYEYQKIKDQKLALK